MNNVKWLFLECKTIVILYVTFYTVPIEFKTEINERLLQLENDCKTKEESDGKFDGILWKCKTIAKNKM